MTLKLIFLKKITTQCSVFKNAFVYSLELLLIKLLLNYELNVGRLFFFKISFLPQILIRQ